MRTVCLIFVLVITVSLCALAADSGQSGVVGTAAASLTNVRQQKTTVQVHEFLIAAPESKPEQHTFVITSEQPIRLSPGTLAPFDNTCYRIRAFQVKRVDSSDSTEPAGYTTCVYGSQVKMKSAAGTHQR